MKKATKVFGIVIGAFVSGGAVLYGIYKLMKGKKYATKDASVSDDEWED